MKIKRIIKKFTKIRIKNPKSILLTKLEPTYLKENVSLKLTLLGFNFLTILSDKCPEIYNNIVSECSKYKNDDLARNLKSIIQSNTGMTDCDYFLIFNSI